jgi:hypothetical protein
LKFFAPGFRNIETQPCFAASNPRERAITRTTVRYLDGSVMSDDSR